MKRNLLLPFLAAAVLATAAWSVSQITRTVIAGGGLGGTGNTIMIRSTAGESIVGSASGSEHGVGSGFWENPPAPSGAAEAPLPTSFRLTGVAPNPARNVTWISYDVPPSEGSVRLRVYDVRGRLVRNLVDGRQGPGRKRLAWDGRDDAGQRLGFGVYVLAFDAPGSSATRKLVFF